MISRLSIMSEDLLIPIVIAAGAILFILLRRSSEIPPLRPPSSEPATGWPAPDTGRMTDLVPITHPLIRKAAERAMARGGEHAKYFVRDGETIYFSLSRIEDPAQRQKAVDLITSIQTKQDVDLTELMQLVRRMFRE